MELEIQNCSEENKRIIEEVQNIVQTDKITAQDLITPSVSLEQKVHEAFVKKPRSNIQEEQANIQEEQANKVNKTACKCSLCICIKITVIAIIMTIIIVIVYLTNAYPKTSKNIFTSFELRDFLDLSL